MPLSKYKFNLTLLLLVLINSKIYSQGTTCAGATSVTTNGACTSAATITDATIDGNSTVCGATVTREAWYRFTATGTTATIVATANNRNVAIELLSACGGTVIGCDNTTTANGTDTETLTATGLTNGNTYIVRIVNVGTSDLNFTSLCITGPVSAPSNDACSGATSLPCGTSNLAGTTAGAVSETSPSGCASSYGVWYTFTGDGNSTTISSTAASGFDHEIDIFSGSCGSLTNLTCTDGASSGGTENYSFATANGTTYYVYVAHYSTSSTTTGTFTISRTCTAPPSNDNCSGATSLPCGTSNLAGTTVGTGSETSPSGCASSYGVWYTFTGDGQITTISSTAASGFDHEIDIFSGSCGSLTNITCTDGAGSGGTESYTFATVNGTNYYVYVANYSTSSTTTGTFTISRTCTAPVANDNCSGATAFPAIPTNGTCSNLNNQTTTNASASGVTPSGVCTSNSGTPDDDVWFSFVATTTAVNLAATYVSGSTDVYWQIFSGSCAGTMTSLLCTDTDAGGTVSGLTIGNTYYIRLYTYSSGVSTTQNICLSAVADPCSTTTNIASCGTSISTTFASGSGIYSSSACGFTTGGKEKIYTFTPATTGIYNIQQGSSFAYIDYQYKPVSAGCSGTGWTCVDDISGAGTSASPMSLTAGVQYYILLDPESTAGGNVTFTIVCPPTPPSNDNCSGAISVTPNSSTSCTSLANGTIYGATASSFTNACGGTADDDVWYSFVATSSTHSISLTNVAGSTTDLYHSVYAGSCASPGTPLVCSDPNTSSISGLILGNTYYVRVYSYSSTGNQTSTFSVCITTPPPSGPCGNPTTNDYCSNPATLSQGAGTFSSSTSSIYSADLPGNVSSIFCGSVENNSWYYFIATSTTASFPFTSISGCTWGDGVQAQVYSVTQSTAGCCTSFTSVSNCYNPGTTSTGTVNATGLVVGQKYILMIDGYAGDVCNFTVSGWTATGILPLEMMTFTGHNEDEKNLIQWVTASERNTDFFRLEKSKDGVNFEKLLDYNAAGNSQSPQYYNAFDLNPFEEITYYRLKLYNRDGSYAYSNIITVNNKNLTEYISDVRPNPTNGMLEFDINLKSKGKVVIDIYDNKGILVHSEKTYLENSYQSLNLDLSNYDSGIYLLKVTFEASGKSEIQKIIKN